MNSPSNHFNVLTNAFSLAGIFLKAAINMHLFYLFIYYLSQVYLVTGTGISDTRSSHYTQFSGILLRPSQDTFRQAIRQAAQVEKKVESNMLDRRAKMKASLALCFP
jgi:hypothetical protein